MWISLFQEMGIAENVGGGETFLWVLLYPLHHLHSIDIVNSMMIIYMIWSLFIVPWSKSSTLALCTSGGEVRSSVKNIWNIDELGTMATLHHHHQDHWMLMLKCGCVTWIVAGFPQHNQYCLNLNIPVPIFLAEGTKLESNSKYGSYPWLK